MSKELAEDIKTAIGNLDTDKTAYEVTQILSTLLSYCQELERRIAALEKDLNE